MHLGETSNISPRTVRIQRRAQLQNIVSPVRDFSSLKEVSFSSSSETSTSSSLRPFLGSQVILFSFFSRRRAFANQQLTYNMEPVVKKLFKHTVGKIRLLEPRVGLSPCNYCNLSQELVLVKNWFQSRTGFSQELVLVKNWF